MLCGPAQLLRTKLFQEDIIFKYQNTLGSCCQSFAETLHMGVEYSLLPVLGVFAYQHKLHPFQEAAACELFFGFISSVNTSIYRDTVNFVKKRPGVGAGCHGYWAILPWSIWVQQLFRKWIIRIAEIEFVRKAIAEGADLSAFQGRPSARVLLGIFLICLGSLLGWPAVALLGFLAVKFQEPLLAVVGGPVVYGVSYIIFGLGMYFSGAKYSIIFLRWLSRVSVEKMLAWLDRQQA